MPRPRATFTKLQKERARQEKQREKNERKQQRKLDKIAGHTSTDEDQALEGADLPTVDQTTEIQASDLP